MVSTKAKTLRKSENVLPPGAKLDDREDVDRLHVNVMEQVVISVKKNGGNFSTERKVSDTNTRCSE
ncbi:MAG: hypothetical protein LBQ23_04060 [Puniceicoccales bacterium]|jgi:hypothetical protein|nr:hypothetical protein [Puniceicoccales bacterium]